MGAYDVTLRTALEARRTRCPTGLCRTATAARPTPGVELAAAALGDARRDVVGIVSGLEPDVEVQPVLGRPLGGWLRAQLEEGTRSDGWRRDRGATPAASVQPVSQDQNSASLSGSAESSGSAAMGPVSAYAARSSMTQQGLPSGSASTTQGTSP